MENAFHVTTQTSGIMTVKNAKAVQKHMYTTKIAEDANAQIICHLILVSNVFNVSSQVIGTQIKEDVFSVQMNKSTIESEQFAPHAPSQLHSLRITNVTVVHKTRITTRLE